jgi:lipopolysaccharide biosynthesis glycosyltransferase
MKQKVAFFTIATSGPPYSNEDKPFEMLKNSLAKFHPDVPLIRIGNQDVDDYRDTGFFFRATPIIARTLIDQYDTVIKIDSDSIVTGDLSELFEGTYDIGLVNNSNPREMRSYPVAVWDIHPLAYVNAGFVVMKSKSFIDHWFNLCMSQHFMSYQMREQDLLNIMAFYGDYQVRFLDQGDSFWGLSSKQYWDSIKMVGDELVLPKAPEWPDKDKKIRVIHYAGGTNNPEKMNINTHFSSEVSKRLHYLCGKSVEKGVMPHA